MPDEQPQDSPAAPPPAREHSVPGHSHAHPHLPTFRFIEELKRRNVGRVAVLYIIISYLVLEVFGVFVHLLELPAWIGRSVVLLVVLGFPVALLIAWIYEITPEGLKPIEDVASHQSIRYKTGKRLDRAIIAVLAIALTYFVADKFWLSKHTTTPEAATAAEHGATPAAATPAVANSDKSIAVLPFVDMSEKHDQEYFSDGLSEELIDHLAHISDLKVIARTSSFAFKGKNEDMRTIATKLGVAHLLEGSVRKAGGELRITAQLIRASDGVHLWSEIYDRRLTDIFKVQDEISTTVAKALNAALSMKPAGAVQSPSKGTSNIEAYNLVLQGNYFYDRYKQGDTFRAIEHYQQALAQDPNYALAWAKLARVYAAQGGMGELSAAEAVAKGRDAAERALAIDPNCAAAYYARGNILFYVTGDWAPAQSDFEKAVALDPHGDMGKRAQANMQEIQVALGGQPGELLDLGRRNLESDPLDILGMADVAYWQYLTGHLEESAVTARKLLELNPTIVTEQAQFALTLLLMGKETVALAEAQKESDEARKLHALVCIYWALGRRAESDGSLGALERGFADHNTYEIASAHAYRGEADAAFVWLERTYQQRRGNLFTLRMDPLLRNLHDDPRFDALLRRVKLIE